MSARFTAPIIVRRMDPNYTAEATHNKISGVVVTGCDTSKTGAAENVKVIVPLGFGLDQSAADALEEWRFAPR